MATEAKDTELAEAKSATKTEPPPESDDPAPTNPAANVQKSQRISVNISQATADALALIATDKRISVTEALRRLVGYGAVVYRATREGHDVLIRRGNQTERVVLVD